MTEKILYVDVAAFQGPMDLLLSLIQQHKVDIYDIPVALIADRFVESLRQMETLDMEITTEFLVLAAQLLFLKSRGLLPRPQKTEEELAEEESLKQDLVERIVAYRLYKDAAGFLQERDSQQNMRYFRQIDVPKIWESFPQPNPLVDVTLDQLWQVFEDILARAEAIETPPELMTAEELPLESMVNSIMRRLLLNPRGLLFSQLLQFRSRLELVVAFLALLELLRGGRLRAEQGAEGIFIVPTDKTRDFADEL